MESGRVEKEVSDGAERHFRSIVGGTRPRVPLFMGQTGRSATHGEEIATAARGGLAMTGPVKPALRDDRTSQIGAGPTSDQLLLVKRLSGWLHIQFLLQ